VIKPNQVEARQLFLPLGQAPESASLEKIEKAAIELSTRTHKPIYITLGRKRLPAMREFCHRPDPCREVTPPLDTVGAGDTFLASLGAAWRLEPAPAKLAAWQPWQPRSRSVKSA